MCIFGASGPKWHPPPNPPSSLIRRVSICLEFKQPSACTVIMPNIAISDELQGKNWFAHALALTTCLVHKSSQNLCQSTFLLQSCNLCIIQCVKCKFESTAGNLPEHTPAAHLGTFHAFLWPGTQTPPLIKSPNKGANRCSVWQWSSIPRSVWKVVFVCWSRRALSHIGVG